MHLKPVFRWRQAAGDIAHSIRPSARWNHAAVMMQSKMYMFGGLSISLETLNDLWVFDVKAERWSEVIADNRGFTFLNHFAYSYSAASTPGQLLITVMMYKKGSTIKNGIRVETWMYIVHAKMWEFITLWSPKSHLDGLLTVTSHKTFYWKGFLVFSTLYKRISSIWQSDVQLASPQPTYPTNLVIFAEKDITEKQNLLIQIVFNAQTA